MFKRSCNYICISIFSPQNNCKCIVIDKLFKVIIIVSAIEINFWNLFKLDVNKAFAKLSKILNFHYYS